MTVSEIERTELVSRLVSVIGEASTETLMNCILPEGRDQLATKADLAALEGKFAVLRGEFAELRGEFAVLRGEFAESRGEFKIALAKQSRQNIMMFAALMLTNWAVVLPFLVGS